MALKRRDFLLFLGASAGTVALGSLPSSGKKFSMPFSNSVSAASPAGSGLSFKPLKGPMPLPTEGMELTKQTQDYSTYEVVDDLVLPEGFTYDVIAAWGDKGRRFSLRV
jgi:secreted PhoX family phosphatase